MIGQEQLFASALQSGIFALLFVSLFAWTMLDFRRREQLYRQDADRMAVQMAELARQLDHQAHTNDATSAALSRFSIAMQEMSANVQRTAEMVQRIAEIVERLKLTESERDEREAVYSARR